MAKYRYAGPGPLHTNPLFGGGEIIRPGDEREFDSDPTWGPWELVRERGHEEEREHARPGPAPLPQRPAGPPVTQEEA